MTPKIAINEVILILALCPHKFSKPINTFHRIKLKLT